MSEEPETQASMPPDWALEIAAQCWCAPTTQHLRMIPELATEFARVLAEQKATQENN